MSEHDPLCDWYGAFYPEGVDPEDCSDCALIRTVRTEEYAAEWAQRSALARMLLESGDITPMGARLLKMPREGR